MSSEGTEVSGTGREQTRYTLVGSYFDYDSPPFGVDSNLWRCLETHHPHGVGRGCSHLMLRLSGPGTDCAQVTPGGTCPVWSPAQVKLDLTPVEARHSMGGPSAPPQFSSSSNVLKT